MCVVLCFCAPAGASVSLNAGDAVVDLGLSLRYDVGYQFTDLGDQKPGYSEDSKTDFYLDAPTDSRVNLKTSLNEIAAFVEYGFGSGDISLRHAYVSWAFTDTDTFAVGQNWSLLGLRFTQQRQNNDLSMFGFGNLYSGRTPQLRYTKRLDTGSFSLVIEDNDLPNLDEWVDGLSAYVAGAYVVDGLVPRMIASYTYKGTGFWVTPSVVAQFVNLEANAPGTRDVDVDAFVLALDGGLDLDNAGLDGAGFDYEVWLGQNVYLVASCLDMRPDREDHVRFGAPAPNANGTDLKDVMSYGLWGQFSLPVDPVTLYAGMGYQFSDVKNTDVPTDDIYYEDDMKTWSVFVSARYNLTKRFYIQPEIAYFNYGNAAQKFPAGYAGNDLGSDTFAGVHFQYDF